MRHIRTAVLGALLLAAGCEGITAAPAPPAVAGAYDMRTVDGKPLPFIFANSDTLVAADLMLSADQSFSLRTLIGRPAGRSYVTQIAGMWTRSGNTISYSDAGRQFATGSYDRGKLTFVQSSPVVTFGFERR